MAGETNVNQECESVSMVQLENKTRSSLTSEQFNTFVENSLCTVQNKSRCSDEQSNTCVEVNYNLRTMNKWFTTVDEKLLNGPVVELIHLDLATLSLSNSHQFIRNHKMLRKSPVTTRKRAEVKDENAVKENRRRVNKRQELKDEQLSNKDSTSSQSVNQLRVLSSSEKHSLTQKNTVSYKNQGNDEFSMSLFERKPQCETSQLNQSSNVRKNFCETSINSNTYVCDLCNKQCACKSKLIRHRRTHTGEKPFVCSFCTKAFSQEGDMNKHKRTHTGEKSFVCSFCSKAFSEKGHLNTHKRTHTGEKPFVCSFCSKAFSQKSSLNVHKRTHTGEKPFVCSFCSKAFSVKGNLDTHKRTHTGEKPFVCSFCSKAFSQKGDMNKHKKTHTGEKPYICLLCPMSTTTKSHLIKHLKRVHSVETNKLFLNCNN